METLTTTNHEYPMLGRGDDVVEGTSVLDAALDAGALFEVKTAPVTLPNGSVPVVPKGKYEGLPERVLVYRDTDEGQHLLNVTSPQWPTSNYLELVEMAEGLFPNSCSGLKVLDGGRRLLFTQEIGEPRDLGGGDLISPNLLWTASLDSSWASGAYSIAHRAFCANQIGMSTKHLKVKRTTNHDIRLLERGAVLAFALEQFEAFAEQASSLRRINVNSTQCWDVIRNILPRPQGKGDEAPTNRALAAWERKVDGIRAHWASESFGPAANTAWALVNAVQSYEYHDGTKGHVDRQVDLTRNGQPLMDATLVAIEELVPA